MIGTDKAKLFTTKLLEWRHDPAVIDYGAIVLCVKGQATMRIDFHDWHLHEGAVITLFPNDALVLLDVSDDFEVRMLRFHRDLLREASVQLEHTVYSSLRADRCRRDRPVVTAIIQNMFNLLQVYFQQEECTCLDQLVLYQLKAFFVGFYEWINRDAGARPVEEECSRRTHELFNRFMEHLELRYKVSRDVDYYASLQHITSKYLNMVVQRVTRQTAKSIIDQYVVMHLKLLLRTSTASIKQVAWDFNFSDESFFCRYFKRHTGVSPQAYRKASAEGGASLQL